MALSSSSPSCLTSQSKYEVFLSFRGEDTRENFTSHLFYVLCQKKIKTFIDEDLKRGDEISPTLLDAIEGSKISVIIFSKDYASSKWCLDELVKILECKKINGQIVLPVFYHVHPSDVRKQTGSYREAFVEHEKGFTQTPEKVQKWRDALTDSSYLSGYESMKIRPEGKLVEVIVKDVLKKLEDLTFSTDSKGLVGINSRIEQVKSLLCIGLQDFRMVGIWGMGGIGKTTLAEAIFKQVYGVFEGKCFIADVREKSERGGGLEQLQKDIIFSLLGENIELGGPNIPQYMKERLRRMKNFIVLDDVNKLGQLEYLVGGLEQFGPESRIIVTTRDKQVLDSYGVDHICKVEGLNRHEALKHFCNFAFGERPRSEELMVLSKKVVEYAKGNPLALKVLGSFLGPKSNPEWEVALHNLKRIYGPDVYNVLKISYDELDWDVKNIFLDIACFFKGDDKDHVTSLFDDPYLVHYGLDILVQKSLVTISNNKLEMHDLLQEMGREIVRQESEEEPGKRSRLWHFEDIFHVLKENKGTDSVKGIFLDLSEIGDIHLDPRIFANMPNLRLLKFYGVPLKSWKLLLPKGLEYLPNQLRYLHWNGYPLDTLPLNFSPKNLIALSLPRSKVQRLWEGKKEASKLKFIDLQFSEYFASFPDLSETPNLKSINLSRCTNLSCFSSSIHNFGSLSFLFLDGCKSLSCFPQISGNVRELNLKNTSIEKVPSSIERLISLENLNMSFGKRLISLPTSICKLKSLRRLDLSFCSKFEKLPEILEPMESLQYINLEGTKIKELPSSIELLSGLTELRLMLCSKLDSLPENVGKLESLKLIDESDSAISRLPSSFRYLSNLTELRLTGCHITEIPPDIGCLSSLYILDLSGNNFENFPSSMKQLSRLRYLHLKNCNMLQSLPQLPLCLEFFDASYCNRLESLPELPECVEKLDASLLEILSQRSHTFTDCAKEKEIKFMFSGCPKLKEKANILEDSRLRFQQMTVASQKLFRFYEKKCDEPAGFEIYLPGSGIPEWFSNQCSGSSITIQLPKHSGCNKNFIGFALCAVFGFEVDDDYSDPFKYEQCSFRLEIKTLCTAKHFGAAALRKCTFNETDQVFLGFDWNVGLLDVAHDTAVSFEFDIVQSFASTFWGKEKILKCCGVCPVYAHPDETQPNSFTLKFGTTSEEECAEIMKLHNVHEKTATSGSIRRSDEEEVEPSSKRIRREQIDAPEGQSSFSAYFS